MIGAAAMYCPFSRGCGDAVPRSSSVVRSTELHMQCSKRLFAVLRKYIDSVGRSRGGSELGVITKVSGSLLGSGKDLEHGHQLSDLKHFFQLSREASQRNVATVALCGRIHRHQRAQASTVDIVNIGQV